MGRRIAPCSIGISYHTEEINWRNSFSMMYGYEVVVPLKIGFPAMRIDQFDGNKNEELLSTSLDLIEEKREIATVKLAHYWQKLKQGYDQGIKGRAFVSGDLVLRRVVRSKKNPAWGKFGPNWERPYRVTSVAGTEAYCLEDLEKNLLPRP